MDLPKFKALFILFALLAIIFAILTAILPLAVKKNVMKSTRKKTELTPGKVKLWGTFPGDLDTKLEHSFKFYDYGVLDSDPKAKLSPSKEIKYIEKVAYSDLKTEEGNQITFKAGRTFEEKAESSNDEVKLPSMGFYEFVQTISHPSSYLKGMNIIKYLNELNDAPNANFERKMFLVRNADSMFGDEQRIKDTILSGITDLNKKDFVYSHSVYGFKSLKTIYKWIKIAGNPEAIKETKWLKEVLGLDDTEIDSIIGTNSLIGKDYTTFTQDLQVKYQCSSSLEDCHILFRQLAEGKLLSDEKIGVKTIAELFKKVNPEQFEFSSPEMNLFYEVLKPEKPFDEIKLDHSQLFAMFGESSKDSLINPENMILLLGSNSEKDIAPLEKYKISSIEQLDFISKYIVEYLPNLYIYLKIENDSKQYAIQETAKAYLKLIQDYVYNSYGLMYPIRDRLYPEIILKMLLSNFPEDKDDICSILLQRVIDDGKKVLKICSDEYFDMTSYEGIKKWAKLSNCYEEDMGDCDKVLQAEFKKKGGLSDEQMKGIFGEDSVGFFFTTANKHLKDTCGCAKKKCTDEELISAQYASSTITMNPPEGIEGGKMSLADWFPEVFEKPFELYYFQKEHGVADKDCPVKIKKALTNLYNEENSIFTDEFKEIGYKDKIRLESIITLFAFKITHSKYSDEYDLEDVTNFLVFMQELVQETRISDTIRTTYKLKSVLEGNNDEDKHFVDLLSNGDYYDYYKPGLSKTTGFNMNIKSNDYVDEQYSFYTKNENDEDKVLRKITKMNNKAIFNIKKEEYSPTESKLITIDAPIFNFKRLDEDEDWVSDGFEYPVNQDLDNVYYFDELSGRKLQFKYKKEAKYHGIDCKKFVLTDDLYQGLYEEEMQDKDYPSVSGKFNKPFVITTQNKKFAYEIEQDTSFNENYICVDEFSNMVVDSNIKLVYAINSTGYNIFNVKAEEGYLPIILYNRHFSMTKETYEDVFSGVKGYRSGRIVIIAIGIFLTAAFINVAVFFFLKHKKSTATGVSGGEGRPSDDVLLPNAFRDSDIDGGQA